MSDSPVALAIDSDPAVGTLPRLRSANSVARRRATAQLRRAAASRGARQRIVHDLLARAGCTNARAGAAVGAGDGRQSPTRPGTQPRPPCACADGRSRRARGAQTHSRRDRTRPRPRFDHAPAVLAAATSRRRSGGREHRSRPASQARGREAAASRDRRVRIGFCKQRAVIDGCSTSLTEITPENVPRGPSMRGSRQARAAVRLEHGSATGIQLRVGLQGFETVDHHVEGATPSGQEAKARAPRSSGALPWRSAGHRPP